MRLTAEECRVLAEGTIVDKRRAAKSAACPVDILEKMVDFSPLGYWPAQDALKNRAFPVEKLEKHISEDGAHLGAALQSKNLTPEMFLRIIKKAEQTVRTPKGRPGLFLVWKLLLSKACPAEVLEKYALFSDVRTLTVVAASPNLPEASAFHLADANSSGEIIFVTLAQRKDLSERVVAVLLGKGSAKVRYRLAKNKTVPVEWLAPMVVRESSTRVLGVLADRFPADLRESVLSRFEGMDKLGLTGARVIASWSDSSAALAKLCYSPNIKVRQIAMRSGRVADEDKVVAVLLGV